MTAQTRATNKGRFEQGDKPQGSDYADLIDSFLSLTDTTAQTITSPASFSGSVGVAATASVQDMEVLGAISVSGSASFGAMTVRGAANVSASASFLGPMSVAGAITGSGTATFPATRQTGGAMGLFVIRSTAATDSTAGNPVKFTLPSGADIVNFLVDVEAPFDTAAGATAANVEVSADAKIATISVSASGRYDLAGATTINTSILRNVTTTVEAWVSIQGSPTAMSAGQAMFTITYVI